MAKKEKKMTGEQYKETQDQIVSLAWLVDELDLKEFINRIDYTEAVAPLFHPTLYMQGIDKLLLIKELAKAFREVQIAFEKLKEEEEEESNK